jgi:hypothetical protein
MRYASRKPHDKSMAQWIAEINELEDVRGYAPVECIECGAKGDMMTHDDEDHPGWLCPPCYKKTCESTGGVQRGTCQFCGKTDATERKDYCTFFEVKCRFCGRAFGA